MDGMHARPAAALAGAIIAASAAHASPPRCASTVVGYAPGSGAGAAYQQPLSAIGEPTRFTGVGVEPGAVTPFRPAFMPGEVVSVGRGGWLVLAFDEPILDDPRHPFGVDLIVYGNAFCADLAYPGGIAGFSYGEGGIIDVSTDGTTWHEVPGAFADGGLPTLGWLDVGPYSTAPGAVPTDAALPVDPSMGPDDLLGMAWGELLATYGGAAGGTNVDLASVGLTSVRFIRIRVPTDAAYVPEIDAVVAVRPAAPAGDLDGNGRIDGADLGILLGDWGSCRGCASDLDGDGAVSGSDLGLLLGAWG